mgnify:FL=1
MAVKTIKKKGLMLCRGKGVEGLDCNIEKDIDSFFDSWSPFNMYDAKAENGRQIKVCKLPYCKDCCAKLLNKYKKEGHSLEGALYMTCAINNVPYIAEKVRATFDYVTNEAKSGKMVKSIFGYYYGMMDKETSKHDLWIDFSRTDIDYKDIATKIEHHEVAKRDIEQLEIDWGKQEPRDYAILTEWFVRYTKNIEFENQNQEDWYRDLCLARLRKRKMEEANEDASKINTVQTQINTICNKLRIDEFESNKAKTPSEKSLFEKITLIDENNVKDIYSEPSKYYDLNKVAKHNKDMTLRTLGNMLVGHRDFNISLDDIDEYNNLE